MPAIAVSATMPFGMSVASFAAGPPDFASTTWLLQCNLLEADQAEDLTAVWIDVKKCALTGVLRKLGRRPLSRGSFTPGTLHRVAVLMDELHGKPELASQVHHGATVRLSIPQAAALCR